MAIFHHFKWQSREGILGRFDASKKSTRDTIGFEDGEQRVLPMQTPFLNLADGRWSSTAGGWITITPLA